MWQRKFLHHSSTSLSLKGLNFKVLCTETDIGVVERSLNMIRMQNLGFFILVKGTHCYHKGFYHFIWDQV